MNKKLRKIILALAVAMCIFSASCGDYADDKTLLEAIELDESGIVSKKIFEKIKEENKVVTVKGQDGEVKYQWSVFGDTITQPRDTDMSISAWIQDGEKLAVHLNTKEDFGFSPVLSVYIPEKWKASSAVVYDKDASNVLSSASVTSGDTTIINFTFTQNTFDYLVMGEDPDSTSDKKSAKKNKDSQESKDSQTSEDSQTSKDSQPSQSAASENSDKAASGSVSESPESNAASGIDSSSNNTASNAATSASSGSDASYASSESAQNDGGSLQNAAGSDASMTSPSNSGQSGEAAVADNTQPSSEGNVQNNAEASASNVAISDGTQAGKDQYATDPVPEGKQQPVEPGSIEIEKDKTWTCTFSIECSTILNNIENLNSSKLDVLPSDGVIFPPTQVSFNPGESVFDILKRVCTENNIHMESEFTAVYNSAYVEGIHNLYEFDCGELSGWMYRVNNWYPNYGASRYVVQNGDVIEWRYTCDLGNDVGGGYATGE